MSVLYKFIPKNGKPSLVRKSLKSYKPKPIESKAINYTIPQVKVTIGYNWI